MQICKATLCCSIPHYLQQIQINAPLIACNFEMDCFDFVKVRNGFREVIGSIITRCYPSIFYPGYGPQFFLRRSLSIASDVVLNQRTLESVERLVLLYTENDIVPFSEFAEEFEILGICSGNPEFKVWPLLPFAKQSVGKFVVGL